jgi:phosphoglycerate dehydrogenase-like enzyme
MKSFQVLRTHISPYQAQDFIQKERELLSSLPQVDYRTLETYDLQKPSILITNTHTTLRELPPGLLRNTKLIIHPNSGYDHFVVDKTLWSEIPVVVGHSIRAQAVAEYTLDCLFQTQRLPKHESWDKKRLWKRRLIRDSKILIFGYGHIGTILERTLSALGAEVTVIDPYKNKIKNWEELKLSEYQVVLSALSLNESSFQIFEGKFFGALHPEVIFINGARGNLYHEEALKTFFTQHPLAQCFLDVFPEEPILNNWTLPNVWKTSHIAGVHEHLDPGILEFEFGVLKNFLEMKPEEFQRTYQSELLQSKMVKGMII